MDLDALRIFVKVAELASFTRAAEQLGMGKARVSVRVQELEAQLGTQLFHRTTRRVHLTQDGEQLAERCQRLLAEADDVQTMFRSQTGLRGRVRVDWPINMARDQLIPRLPEFLAAHPQLEVQLSTTDQRVDPVQDGFDFVLRIGALHDSGLIAKRLGSLQMVNCASAAYLAKYGVPRVLADLDRHVLVRYSLGLSSDEDGLEYQDGDRYRLYPMRSVLTVNNADAYRVACLAGLGIIQAPRIGMQRLIAEGQLVEIVPHFTCRPMQVSLVYANARVPKRVRAMMAWVAQVLEPFLT